MLTLDPIQTLAAGGLCLLAGYAIRRRLPQLARFNIPASVIGGLLVALALLACRHWDAVPVQFDTTLERPLMIAFFTSIGFNASVSLLRISGRQVALFLGLATFLAVVQNVVGIGLAKAFGLSPLFGVVAGSATLTGGPATGLAFAPLFEQAGVVGAKSIALASAMAGIVIGSIVGAPLATMLIERHKLAHAGSAAAASSAASETPAAAAASNTGSTNERLPHGLKSLVLLLVAMGLGAWVSDGLHALDLTMPSYIGAMLVGAVMRNIDDHFGWFGLSVPSIDTIGSICLSLFLAVALMDLHLWELAGVATPLLVNLGVQTIIVVAFCCWPLLQLMGRDYDAAVMTGGFAGFMLGITANAMAVMDSLTERFGPAPRAFLVAPLVGAFLIDFTNAIVITFFINAWK
ncbi:MAG: sodium/glutamate symporter [Rudaea sp.]|uniref:sodium/glutamate symporter n=1 Tax=unclassified Rudaea TaxID=2627037 RepID=UPI0010F78D33|nr:MULTISPECIES: sodium/glutamate symporter [unclassified Rudaea]MBN8885083.1 sodium/glutamate symporter [Rudaea sp.]MBR0344762.1 sodium/glutamate symporter [Rudaea sp.]